MCNEIPSEISEISTPEVAKAYPHLSSIAGEKNSFHKEASTHLLIGRDLAEVHHVQRQIAGPIGTPFARKISLG